MGDFLKFEGFLIFLNFWLIFGYFSVCNVQNETQVHIKIIQKFAFAEINLSEPSCIKALSGTPCVSRSRAKALHTAAVVILEVSKFKIEVRQFVSRMLLSSRFCLSSHRLPVKLTRTSASSGAWPNRNCCQVIVSGPFMRGQNLS